MAFLILVLVLGWIISLFADAFKISFILFGVFCLLSFFSKGIAKEMKRSEANKKTD